MGSIVGFVCVMMTYYGVNYVLPEGLHSCGGGTSAGQYYVIGAVVLDISLVIAGVVLAVLADRGEIGGAAYTSPGMRGTVPSESR